MRCDKHQDVLLFPVVECPVCLLDRLAWIRRNIKRIKDFAFTGDAYRQQINSTVDYIIGKINEELGDDPDEETDAVV